MYTRNYKPLENKSFFLFGPRGTGKTTWIKEFFKEALFIDLLNSENYRLLLGNPFRLEAMIPVGTNTVIIDEVQKVPELLNSMIKFFSLAKLNFK